MIKEFKNRHVGQAACVVGSGPSLRGFNFDRCGSAVVFAINAMADYVAADYMAFTDRATYITNSKLNKTLMDFSGEVFCPDDYQDYFKRELTEIDSKDWMIQINRNMKDPNCKTRHIPYTSALAIWLAVEMGCAPIYLLGFDFRLAADGCHHTCAGGRSYTQGQLNMMHYRQAKFVRKARVKVVKLAEETEKLSARIWRNIEPLQSFDLRSNGNG